MTQSKQDYTASIDVVESDAPVLLLRAAGYINTGTYAFVEATALRIVKDTESDVVIEASDVRYLSTAGIRVFLRMWLQLNKTGHSLYVCSLKPYIRQVVELLAFDRMIKLHPDVDSALSAISRGR